jgi:hypothetical protein
MTKKSVIETLTGKDNFDMWKNRMELRVTKKGFDDLMRHGEDYVLVLEERKTRDIKKVEPAEREPDSDDDDDVSVATSKASFTGLTSTMESIEIVRMAEEKLYCLITEQVCNKIFMKLQRRSKNKGTKAWNLLEGWYGVQASQTHKVLGLKNDMLLLKASVCGDFIGYMDELMEIQDKLEKMGKGIESDMLMMMITNQIPKEYDQIIAILTRKIDEEVHIEVEEWMDIVEAHVNMVDSRLGNPKDKGKRHNTSLLHKQDLEKGKVVSIVASWTT